MLKGIDTCRRRLTIEDALEHSASPSREVSLGGIAGMGREWINATTQGYVSDFNGSEDAEARAESLLPKNLG